MRKVYFYLGYLALILVYFFCSYKLLNIIRLKADAMYDMRPWTICNIISYLIFGFILALDYIVKQSKKKGQWRLLKSKILILGLPILVYMVLTVMQLYIPINLPRIFYNKGFMPYIPILLGFVLGTSFYKQNYQEKEV